MRSVLVIGSEEWLLITIIDIYGGNSQTYFRSSIQSLRTMCLPHCAMPSSTSTVESELYRYDITAFHMLLIIFHESDIQYGVTNRYQAWPTVWGTHMSTIKKGSLTLAQLPQCESIIVIWWYHTTLFPGHIHHCLFPMQRLQWEEANRKCPVWDIPDSSGRSQGELLWAYCAWTS